MPATQAVGIGDDGDGARGHCCCGEQRTEQEPSKGIEQSHRDGNAQAIVDESTKQILAHIAHGGFRDGDGGHHPLEASTDQRDIGGFNRHIRSGSNRKADMGLGEGWRIIDAVTYHPHLLSFQLQFRERKGVGSHNQYLNNIVYGNGDAPFGDEQYHWPSAAGSKDINTITQDAQFVNYQSDGNGDYHVQASSPAIGAGTNIGAPSTDFDGERRSQGKGIDIGPYQSS